MHRYVRLGVPGWMRPGDHRGEEGPGVSEELAPTWLDTQGERAHQGPAPYPPLGNIPKEAEAAFGYSFSREGHFLPPELCQVVHEYTCSGRAWNVARCHTMTGAHTDSPHTHKDEKLEKLSAISLWWLDLRVDLQPVLPGKYRLAMVWEHSWHTHHPGLTLTLGIGDKKFPPIGVDVSEGTTGAADWRSEEVICIPTDAPKERAWLNIRDIDSWMKSGLVLHAMGIEPCDPTTLAGEVTYVELEEGQENEEKELEEAD